MSTSTYLPVAKSNSPEANRYPFAIQYWSDHERDWIMFDFCASKEKGLQIIREYRSKGAKGRYRVATVEYIDKPDSRLPTVTDTRDPHGHNLEYAIECRTSMHGWQLYDKAGTQAEGNRAIGALNRKYGAAYIWRLAKVKYI